VHCIPARRENRLSFMLSPSGTAVKVANPRLHAGLPAWFYERQERARTAWPPLGEVHAGLPPCRLVALSPCRLVALSPCRRGEPARGPERPRPDEDQACEGSGWTAAAVAGLRSDLIQSSTFLRMRIGEASMASRTGVGLTERCSFW